MLVIKIGKNKSEEGQEKIISTDMTCVIHNFLIIVAEDFILHRVFRITAHFTHYPLASLIFR